MTLTFLWLGLPLLASAGFFAYTFNRLVAGRNACANARASIEVNLKRRHQLIPNLVQTVKGYTAHEQQSLLAVTAARTRAIAELTTSASPAAEEQISASRRAFNSQVMRQNNLIQHFPTLLVANTLGYQTLMPYAADAPARSAPAVSL